LFRPWISSGHWQYQWPVQHWQHSHLRPPALVNIPFVQNVLVDAINLGQPPVYARPHELISGLLEDLSFRLSKEIHKKNKPEDPTDTWNRVYKRYQERKK